MPMASPLLLTNHVARIALEGNQSDPIPNPIRKPCTSNSCQYWAPRLVMNIPKTRQKLPTQSRGCRYPKSYSGADQYVPSSRRLEWMVPIHDMFDADS